MKEEIETARIMEDVVLNMAEKVTYKIGTKVEWRDSVAGYVEIKLKNKEIKSKKIEFVYGYPQNPIDSALLASEFFDCASYSPKRIPEGPLERVVQMIMNLEDLRDATELTREV